MTFEIAVIAFLAIVQVLQHFRQSDCQERIHMARQQAQRETHNQWANIHRNAMDIYRSALREGFEDLDQGLKKKDEDNA
jgi:hypothetical protein